MKNSNALSLVLVIGVFIVMACTCPRNLSNLSKEANTTTTSTPSNTTTTTTNTTTTTDDKSALSMDKYNRIKDGMSHKEVSDILGSSGVEQMSSGTGKYKVTSYKWEGDNYSFISVTFIGDKMTSKVQYGIK